MSPVSRDTTAGRAYLDLQAMARRTGRPTQELLVLYVLERFLFRLAFSTFRDRLVLKGGMLLAALDSRRPTADIDLLARAISNDADEVTRIVFAILQVPVDDGVVYDPGRMSVRAIRDTEPYAGTRLSLPAQLGQARVVLRLDINVGDPVTPAPVEVEYPALLEGSFRLLGYPLATVLAEKVVTMVERGVATTRERDFADVVLLSRRHPVDAAELLAALRATAAHRGSTLRPLGGWLARLGALRQASWSAYIDRSGLAEVLPIDYEAAIAAVSFFVDPLLDGSTTAGSWDPIQKHWSKETGA